MIRELLRRKLDGLERLTDLPEAGKYVEIQKLRIQLDNYQRSPRPIKLELWAK